MKAKPFGLEEYKLLVDATFKLLEANKEENSDFNTILETNFLGVFIKELVIKTLTNKELKATPKKDQFNEAKRYYGELKSDLQEAVALGLQAGMERFSDLPIEYYCLIKTVQESKSNSIH